MNGNNRAVRKLVYNYDGAGFNFDDDDDDDDEVELVHPGRTWIDELEDSQAADDEAEYDLIVNDDPEMDVPTINWADEYERRLARPPKSRGIPAAKPEFVHNRGRGEDWEMDVRGIDWPSPFDR